MKTTNLLEKENKEILDKFGSQIEVLKSKQELSQEDKEFLIKSIRVLKDIFKDSEEQKVLDAIFNKLESKQSLTLQDFEKIDKFVVSLKNKEKEISQIELQRLREILESKKIVKEELSEVKKRLVSKNLNISAERLKRLEEYKDKIVNYIKQFKSFQKQYPWWSKAMLTYLPTNFVSFFHNKKEDNESLTKFWKIFNEIKKILETIVTSILWFLFDLFAPKELKEFVSKVKKDFSKLSQEDVAIIRQFLMKDKDYIKILKTNEDLIDDVKTEIWENKEQIEKYKEVIIKNLQNRLASMLWIYSKQDKKKLKDILEKWWEKDIVSNRQELKNVSKENLEKLKAWNIESISFDNLFYEILWFSGISFLKLMVRLTDAGLMKPGQLAIELWKMGVEKWVNMAINSFLFFPKVATYIIKTDKLSLEDIYNFVVDNDNLSEQSRMLLLVGIYRTINTWWFRYLGYLASLPFYPLSFGASLWGNVKKTHLFFEGIAYKNIEKQLKLLSEVESKILNISEKDGIFSHLLEAFRQYKKAISVSIAYQKAKNLDEFKNILKQHNLLEDKEVKNLLEELTNDIFKTKKGNKVIADFIHKIKWSIENFDDVFWKQWIQEFKKYLWPYFWRTRFYDDTLSLLKESLAIQESLYNEWKLGKVSKKIEDYIRRFKFGVKISWLTDTKDALHFQDDIKSFKDFVEDLKILVKESPHLARYIFRTFPIWILSKDIIDKIRSWDGEVRDVIEIMTTFIPIVWPIVFLSEEWVDKDWQLKNEAVWVALAWMGIDTFVLINSVKKIEDLLRLITQPVVDLSRWVLTAWQILVRVSGLWRIKIIEPKKIGRIEKIEIFIRRLLESWKFWEIFKGKVWRIVAVLAIYYGSKEIYNIISENLEKNRALIEVNLMKEITQKAEDGTEAINQYIFENWSTFDMQEKEILLGAYIAYYLWLSPFEVEEYIKDIKYDENTNTFNVSLTDKAKDLKNIDFKIRMEDLLPRINILADKLDINVKIT